MRIKATKDGKAECPDCGLFVEIYEDNELSVMVLKCCRTWSLFPTKTEAIKPAKPKARPSKSNEELLNKLKDYHYGKKEQESDTDG